MAEPNWLHRPGFSINLSAVDFVGFVGGQLSVMIGGEFLPIGDEVSSYLKGAIGRADPFERHGQVQYEEPVEERIVT